jgi:hypothetical protein
MRQKDRREHRQAAGCCNLKQGGSIKLRATPTVIIAWRASDGDEAHDQGRGTGATAACLRRSRASGRAEGNHAVLRGNAHLNLRC